MSATRHPEHVEIDLEVLQALDVIRRKSGLKNPVDLLIEAGLSPATAYRRIKNPGQLTLGELRTVSAHYDVPLHVLAEGELATLRWWQERRTPGPDGPGAPVGASEYAPRDSNPEPADSVIVPLTRRNARRWAIPDTIPA